MRQAWSVPRVHGPVLGLLLAVVYLVYGRLGTGDWWFPTDFAILVDTHRLTHEPLAMFRHLGAWFSQPLLQLSFLGQYSLFDTDYGAYIAVNLALHVLCAFVIYLLVYLLFDQRSLAIFSALLFALNVGSYGHNLQSLAGQESLLLALLHLAVLYLFIHNDVRREGRLRSPYFLLGVAIYSLTGLTRASTLSLMGGLLAYKAFFYKRRKRRPIFSNDLLVFLVLGTFFKIGQSQWGFQHPSMLTSVDSPLTYTYQSAIDLFRYLNLMVFPLQEGRILREAGAFLQSLHDLRMPIRTFVTLGIVSFSFFGFVFGNRPLRFFIALTYIMLIPFSTQQPGVHWLNLTHLYLSSMGFCLVLATAALGCSRLLQRHRWRRLVPFAVPLLFVLVAVSLTYRLDESNRAAARSPAVQEIRREAFERLRQPAHLALPASVPESPPENGP
jgi:hypothetical protein